MYNITVTTFDFRHVYCLSFRSCSCSGKELGESEWHFACKSQKSFGISPVIHLNFGPAYTQHHLEHAKPDKVSRQAR